MCAIALWPYRRSLIFLKKNDIKRSCDKICIDYFDSGKSHLLFFFSLSLHALKKDSKTVCPVEIAEQACAYVCGFVVYCPLG